jgi:Flp pilus assembly CpaF family ATPase
MTAAAEATLGALHPSDRAAERLIRERVAETVSRSLGDGRLLAPGSQEEERVRAIIDEEVAAHERRAVTTNTPLLLDADAVRRRLFDSVFGLGILQPLMVDPRVEEIIVNGPLRVFTIRDGRKEQVHGVYFENDDELRQLVKRIVSGAGRRLDEASPMVDVRLQDGSRLNAVITPASTRFTSITIRKFVLRAHSLDQLVELGALSSAAAEFLDAAVQSGVNILVSGPTGSGKTTLLNALGASIVELDERVVTVEEVPELMLDRRLPDCVALQVRNKNVEGIGEITIRDLVRNALTKVHRFEASTPARHIVGQPASTIDPSAWLREGTIVIVNTARGIIGESAAALIGSTLLNLVTLAVAGQASLSADARWPISIFVDEFHTIPGADYEGILAELSKYGANLVLATQSLARLLAIGQEEGRGLRATVFANLDGLFAFNCSAEDAEYLVAELGGAVDEQDLLELGEHHCYVRLSSRGERLPTFSVHLDPPLESDPRLRTALARASAERFGRDADRVEADRRAAVAMLQQYRTSHLQAALSNPQTHPPTTPKAPARNEHRQRKRRKPEVVTAQPVEVVPPVVPPIEELQPCRV